MLEKQQRDIVAPILISIGISLVALVIIFGVISYTTVYNESINTLRQQNRAVVNRLEGWLEVKSAIIENNALLLRNPDITIDMVMRHITAQAEMVEDVSIVFAGFPDGRFIFSGEWEVAEDLYLPFRPWYRAAVQSPGQVVFTRPYMGAATLRLGFAAARTVGDYDDSLGVIALSIPFAAVIDHIEHDTITRDNFSIILDSYGSVLSHPNPAFAPIGDLIFQHLSQIEGGRYLRMFESVRNEGVYQGNGAVYIGTAIPSMNWYVITRIPTSYIVRSVFPTMFGLLVTLFFAAATLVGTGIILRKIKLTVKREREAMAKEREMDAKLHEAEALNKLMLDTSPLIIEMWDDEKKMVYCNQQALDVAEVATVEEYRDMFYSLATPYQPDGTPSRVRLDDMLDKALKEGYARFEWADKSVEEGYAPYDTTLIRITRNGKYVIMGYSLDVRDLKHALATATEADERTKLMLEATPLSCILVRQNTTEKGSVRFEAIDYNRAALELFGFSSKAEALARFNDLFQETSRDKASYMKLLSDTTTAFEKGFHQFEFTHKSMKGELIPCEVTLVRVDYKGEPVLACYQNDLRSIKEAIEKEHEALEWMQRFFDSSPVLVEIWDESLNLIDCNRFARIMFSIATKEEYIERYSEFLPEFQPCGTPSKDKIASLVRETLRKGFVRSEWLYILPDGEPLPVETRFVRLHRSDGNVVVAYSHDLRQVKAAMDKEQAAADESRAKTRFLARMSHEIRTPMNAVLGITEIQLQKGGHSFETEEAFLRIYSSSRLLLTLINDILDLSKVEAGKMEIVSSIYETASLVADTVQLNLMYIGSKRITFEQDIDHNMPARLIGDELRIKQILNNILSNALKYTAEGKVIMSVVTEKEPEGDDCVLVISISDSGYGMTKEQVDNLFSKEFTRYNLESSSGIEGSGLGMSITFSLIEMMGGDIKVKSEPGVGSTFTVRVPQKISGSQVIGKETVESLRNWDNTAKHLRRMSSMLFEPMPYGRVLVVDDVDSNLYVVKGLLFPYNLKVETVESGFQAIAKIENGEVYDIIFMDHMMPVMDGIEAARKIRDSGYNHPIVALTANVLAGTSKIFLQNGFDDFIAKPIDPLKLDACLKKFIRDKQPREVLDAVRLQYQRKSIEAKADSLSRRLIKSFLLDAKKSIAILEPLIKRQEMDSSDIKAYTIQVHGMKSALHNIGRRDLSKVASSLEHAGRGEDRAAIKGKTPRFLEDLKKLTEELSAKNKKDKPGISPASVDAGNAILREQWLSVYAACKTYDIKGLQALLAKLKQEPLSKQTASSLDKIEDHLLLSDFEDAARVAEQAANMIPIEEKK